VFPAPVLIVEHWAETAHICRAVTDKVHIEQAAGWVVFVEQATTGTLHIQQSKQETVYIEQAVTSKVER